MREHVEIAGHRFLGWGPSATGEESGWRLSIDLFARCGHCGDLIVLWPDVSGSCACGNLYKDVDAGRFGSGEGDGGIAIYQRLT